MSGLILDLELESRKFISEKSNPAKTAERYVSCYESTERIILLLFDYLDIPVKTGNDVHDGETIHGAILERLSSDQNSLYIFLGQGPAYLFLKDANVFRRRWRNRPRKDTSVLNNTPTRSSMADSFGEIEDSLRSALQAVKKEAKRREDGYSMWDLLRNKEITLAMKEEDLYMKERKLEKWEEEGEPRKEKIVNKEKELERAKEAFKKEIEAFHAKQKEYQDEREIESAELENKKEQLAAQRYDNAEELRKCYIERANDHKLLEEEISKTEKTRFDLQIQNDAELAKVRKDLEKEILKTRQARTELEVTVGCLQNMVVSYRISRMQYAPCEENDPKIGRVEDKLTLMVTELLTDLTMAGIETNRLEAEKETLLSRVHNLEAQLATSEQPQYTMESESAEQDRVSSDDEGTSFSGLELGDDRSDGSAN